ncbi:MAG: nicotinamide-nucleotide amidohydrolase family protein [Anaerolineaceae bacterium]|mgnify:FL=1|nr:nicotinamide-nucleotide amidohydrolase family protein [Anaerolineaceae bacterium]MDD4043320.1 nicotinamide-nucleotide amidohydrolase family protein [Anaerolineaceae bacterium]MDD4577764.1 nicotinamide-nucleotide amidohydrolase family protein [Anaerolineaceae bacterium]
MKKRLILVFGTSADPIHEGHVELIVDAVRALRARGFSVAEVVLMPVFRHHNIREGVKRSLTLTFDHRFALCQLAAAEIARVLDGEIEKVSVSSLERELVWQSNRPNFTAETMEALRARTDQSLELAFLIGADSFSGEQPNFLQWYRWEELIKDAMLVISPRVGFQPNQSLMQDLTSQGARIVYLEEIVVSDISSSRIRARLEAGALPADLVAEGLLSEQIAAYIAQNDLINIWRQIDSKAPLHVITEEIEPTDNLETRIGKRLFEQKLTLGLAESCTGGLIGHRITNVPGSSDYFMGSIVSYAYQAKVSLLGVSWETLKKHGAVSSQVVLQMARGARRAFNSDLGLSVSCIAGPGGATTDKPVGTSWVGLSTPDGDWAYNFQLHGDRQSVKAQLAQNALEKLGKYLEERSQSQESI